MELERGPRGFGFSLRGGTEYNMGLYILRLAEDAPAQLDGRIHVSSNVVVVCSTYPETERDVCRDRKLPDHMFTHSLVSNRTFF